ncbi:hypothetical protein Hanom_Chr11g01013641 [Helianthus anomalus]
MSYSSRHETLSAATDQIHRIVIEFVELFAAQGENTPIQPSSSQATEVATDAAVEGELGKDAGGSGGKGPVEGDLGDSSNDSDHDGIMGEHFITNDDLEKDDEVVGIVEELRSDEDVDHVSAEGVEVDFEDLWGITYNDTSVEANPNPEPIPEEV